MYVMKLARKYDIPLRRKREARYLALKAGKLPQKYRRVNHNFFSVWTSEMTYVLGYFCADGNLHRDKRSKGWRVHFSSNDRAHMETLRRVMESTHGFTTRKKQPKLLSLDIGSEKLAIDLLALGITERKSLTLQFPNVPQKYLNDFIRGYFDGDGTIYLEGRRAASPRVSFVSGSKRFLLALKENLEAMLPGVRGRLYNNKTELGRVYLLRYSRQGDLIKVFEYLYPEGARTLCLSRKRQKFQGAVTHLREKNEVRSRRRMRGPWRMTAPTKEERIQRKKEELQNFARFHPEYRKWVEGRIKVLEQMKKGKGLL